MIKNNFVPKRRFKEFRDTGDWEQKKFRELTDNFEYGLNASAKEFDGVHKYIRITDIDDKNHIFIQSGLTSPDIDFTKADNYKLQRGDILFARTGASVGKTYLYRESDGLVYYAGFLIRARIKSNFDSEFVFQNTLTDNYDQFIKITSQRSGQPGVNAEEYSNFKIMVPSYEEQVEIGNFFSQLDDTIVLQQRKLEKLKSLKVAYLAEMFPAEGEKKPKRRFEGFTDDWEQCKIGDHAEILTGGTPQTSISEFWNPKQIPWMSSGEVNKGRLNETDNMISERGLNNSSARWIKEYSVLIALAGQGKTRGTVAINNIKLTTNQSIAAIVPNDNLHYEFIYQNLIKRYDELRMISSGDGTRGGLNKQIVSNVVVPYPSKKEQIRIGTLFQQLDNTIALHQRKLEKLQNLKKAYLSEMFL